MQDELLMRRWSEAHEDFSEDMHTAVQRLGRRLERLFAAIHTVYSPALRGALAGAITIGLWASVLSLAAPSAPRAEALPFELAAATGAPTEWMAA